MVCGGFFCELEWKVGIEICSVLVGLWCGDGKGLGGWVWWDVGR